MAGSVCIASVRIATATAVATATALMTAVAGAVGMRGIDGRVSPGIPLLPPPLLEHTQPRGPSGRAQTKRVKPEAPTGKPTLQPALRVSLNGWGDWDPHPPHVFLKLWRATLGPAQKCIHPRPASCRTGVHKGGPWGEGEGGGFSSVPDPHGVGRGGGGQRGPSCFGLNSECGFAATAARSTQDDRDGGGGGGHSSRPAALDPNQTESVGPAAPIRCPGQRTWTQR